MVAIARALKMEVVGIVGGVICTWFFFITFQLCITQVTAPKKHMNRDKKSS